MLIREERVLVVRFARRLAPDGLAVGSARNLSVRAGDLVAVTPSALAYAPALLLESLCDVFLCAQAAGEPRRIA